MTSQGMYSIVVGGGWNKVFVLYCTVHSLLTVHPVVQYAKIIPWGHKTAGFVALGFQDSDEDEDEEDHEE